MKGVDGKFESLVGKIKSKISGLIGNIKAVLGELTPAYYLI